MILIHEQLLSEILTSISSKPSKQKTPELGLEGQLSSEDLGSQWEHNLHELSPQVKKCDGAESVTLRLKEMGIPQVTRIILATAVLYCLLLLAPSVGSI